jgi:hypothetical protein
MQPRELGDGDTRIREVIGSNLGLYTAYSNWGFPGFLHTLQADVGIVAWLDHDGILSDSFQFIRPTIRRCSTAIDSVVE